MTSALPMTRRRRLQLIQRRVQVKSPGEATCAGLPDPDALRRRHYQFVVDLRDQALVAAPCRTESPPGSHSHRCHQHLTGKAGIAAQQRCAPVASAGGETARQCARLSGSTAPAEPSKCSTAATWPPADAGRQKIVERQIAVAVVIAAWKNSTFLLPRAGGSSPWHPDRGQSAPEPADVPPGDRIEANNVSIIAASWLTL